MTIQEIFDTDNPNDGRQKTNSNFEELDGRTEGLEAGLTGEVILKLSNAEGDFDWRNAADAALKGDPGEGVPVGGTTGQLLAKDSGTDYDTEWIDASEVGSRAAWDPVIAATTVDITLSGEQTIDGVSVVAGDRVLVWQQSGNIENGIYVVASGAWSRAEDADTASDFLEGKTVESTRGTENERQIWCFVDQFDIELETDPIYFSLAINASTETQWGTVRSATQSEVDSETSGTDIVVRPATLAAYPRLPSGYAPFALPVGVNAVQASDTAITLAANGGTIAIPVLVSSRLLLQSVSFWNTDTGTARGDAEFALFKQNSVTNTLDRVSGAVGTLASWTPSAASVRTISVTTPPATLYPGLYWLALKNNHASNTLGVGSTAAAAASLALNTTQTKTLTTSAFGSTLDFTAATWTKRTEAFLARLNGRAFGQSSAF